MSLDPGLLELLVCPACHGAVVYHERLERIDCTSCGLRYPVRDGIPIMLIDEAERPATPPGPPGPEATGASAREPLPGRADPGATRESAPEEPGPASGGPPA